MYILAGGDYAGVFWGTGDAGAASPVSLTYQSNKGFAFEGGNVGIGTTDPGPYKLNVQGGLSVGVDAISTSAAYFNGQGYRNDNDQGVLGHIRFDNQNGGNTAGKIEVFAGGSQTSGTMRFHTSGSEKVRIAANGSVGIGTTNPNKTLEVAGNIRATKTSVDGGDIALGLNVGGSADHPVLDIYDKDGNDGARITANGNSWLSAKGGNVGIGTTSPNISQSASGSTVLTVSASETRRVGVLELKGTRSKIGDPVGYLRTFNNADNSPITDIQSIRGADSNEGGGPYGKLLFRTSGEDAMLIDTAGNVGIGTTSPLSDFVVRGGTDSTASSFEINCGNNSLTIDALQRDNFNTPSPIRYIGESHSFLGSTGGAGGSGNVGIGTTDPGSYKLNVNGISNFSGNSNWTSGTHLYWNGGDVGITNSGKNLLFKTYGSDSLLERVRIDSSGNVGIGTTSPDFNLSVVSDTGPAKIGIHGYGSFSDGSVAAQLLFLGKDSNGGNRNLAHIQVKEHAHASGTGSMEFFTRKGGNEAARMVIDSAGNVGIGTTSPSGKFQVKGGTSYLEGISLSPSSGSLSEINSGSSIYGIQFKRGSINTMTIKGDNVGIGTTNPGAKLEIRQQITDAREILYPLVLKSEENVGANRNLDLNDGVGIKFLLADNTASASVAAGLLWVLLSLQKEPLAVMKTVLQI